VLTHDACWLTIAVSTLLLLWFASFYQKDPLSSEQAKTGISVSIGDNTGEAYPLVYVVVCTPI
jgi:hypothetical protein